MRGLPSNHSRVSHRPLTKGVSKKLVPLASHASAHVASCVSPDQPPKPAARTWFTAIARPAAAATPATISPAIHLISRASRA